MSEVHTFPFPMSPPTCFGQRKMAWAGTWSRGLSSSEGCTRALWRQSLCAWGGRNTEGLMFTISEGTVAFGGHLKTSALRVCSARMSFSISLLFALILTAYTYPPRFIYFLFLLSKGQCCCVQAIFNSSLLGLFSELFALKRKKSSAGEQWVLFDPCQLAH